MNRIRAVLDTNVLISAFRSKRGSSFEVFRRLRLGEWTVILSNHLLYEYEEIMKREALALELSLSDVDEILNAVCTRSEEWPLRHGWDPILFDPDDEPMVQLAHESEAMLIITHNVRHLEPAQALGIQILKPGEFLGILTPRP